MRQPRTVGEMLERSREFLGRKGIREARLDADLLVAHALGVDRLHLLLQLEQPLGEGLVDRARELLMRRGRREPVAYITGTREFYARPFRVRTGVLIPRPETEMLVDLARDHQAEHPVGTPHVLDVGTGSGCLAATLALELEGAKVTAVDLSEAALSVARENFEQLGCEVTCELGDGLELGERGAPWDLVVSNPPYVDAASRAQLEPEVQEFEPAEALFAPQGDPDFWARELIARAQTWLKPGGLLLVELGFDQHTRLESLLHSTALETRIENDLEGIPRVLCLQLPRD